MTEGLSPIHTPPEIQATRKGLEQEIIEKGICPSLAEVVQPVRDQQGQVNWDAISHQVEVTSYRHLLPSSDALLTNVANSYHQFIDQAARGSAPRTIIHNLP